MEAVLLKTAAVPSLSDHLFERLQTDILSGALAPGEKLTEQRVCDEYAVSRTPVREAFRLLERSGLIETVPNRGAFVVGFSRQDLEDMYELRKTYEILAVRWAILRMTDEERSALAEAYEFMEFYTKKGDGDKMLAINMNFHQLIYNGSHNRMLANVLSMYQIYTQETRSGGAYPKKYLNEVLAEHRQIYEAFQNQDADAGETAMIIHLEHAKERAQNGRT